MPTQRYEVTQPHADTLLAWGAGGEIAVPEIQRPFEWQATDAPDPPDSLLSGFPIGYLIAWLNLDVKLNDGSRSVAERILIDGRQRVTALTAALMGREVVTRDYGTVRIRIAFHPGERRFEVLNPAIGKSPACGAHRGGTARPAPFTYFVTSVTRGTGLGAFHASRGWPGS